MSVHVIYYKDGAKMMRPVQTRAEYMQLRDSDENRRAEKRQMVQMNYSCLPNDDGSLKGSTRMTTTVGMDIDEPISTDLVLSKKEELGLLMFENSATKPGCGHVVFRRRPELSQEENLRWASEVLGVPYDKGAKDITRVFYTPADKLVFLDDSIFLTEEQKEVIKTPVKDIKAEEQKNIGKASLQPSPKERETIPTGSIGPISQIDLPVPTPFSTTAFDLCVEEAGLKSDNLDVWGEHNWHANLMAVLSVGVTKLMSKEQLMAVVRDRLPNYSQTEDCTKLINYFYENYSADKGFMSAALREINAKAQRVTAPEQTSQPPANGGETGYLPPEDEVTEDALYYYSRIPNGVKVQGIIDSIEAAGPTLTMPTLVTICPCIGARATGVKLDVHGKANTLNLISYVAGEFASGKGQMDDIVQAWMAEDIAMAEIYNHQWEEWRDKYKQQRNKKDLPVEPKLPKVWITLNNTTANLAEALANVQGRHAFSFTPEADVVSLKWRSSVSDFSTMIRQSYDGSSYDREARSVDAVNVHIPHLLWNVVMCGTPDALYRVIDNYTDGFQSRVAVARTPDNTFAPLEDNPAHMTDLQRERIMQVSHLLPLMNGTIVLPKLEKTGRQWLEMIRTQTHDVNDRVMGKQRMRVCVTAQRMTCCLMLVGVCAKLIKEHGVNGAETRLRQDPYLWQKMVEKMQTEAYMDMFWVIADSLIDNAMYYFRDRIEAAMSAPAYVGTPKGEGRQRKGKNDTIYYRLPLEFTFEEAMSITVEVKGTGVTKNAVQQMFKNWLKQEIIAFTPEGKYRKVNAAR